MADCKVTKIKGVINDDDLVIYDTVEFVIDHATFDELPLNKRFINLNSYNVVAGALKNIGGEFLDENGNSLGSTLDAPGLGNHRYYLSLNTDKVLFVGKNNIRDTGNTTYEGFHLKLKSLAYSSIRQLNLQMSNQIGDLSDLGGNAPNLITLYCNTCPVTGDIADLRNMTALETCTFSHSNGFSGDFASWCYKSDGTKTPARTVNVTLGGINNYQYLCNGEGLNRNGSYTLTFDGNGGVTYTFNGN